MKVLLYDETPAYLCHGGKQVLVQKLYENLSALGVTVEYARWWDSAQECDLIHSFSVSPGMVWAAQQAGVGFVLTHIVDRLTNLSGTKRRFRQLGGYAIRNLLPERLARLLPWHVPSDIDSFVYLHEFDLEAAVSIYGVPRVKTRVIPHGCDINQIACLQSGSRNERSHLISIASIVPRKNSLLLAKAARRARVPIVFLGKPFNEQDQYYQRFLKFVDDKWVIYPGYVSEEDKKQWLTDSSGFVLFSEAESGCIAVYEAATAGLPMLLSNRPWAWAYGKQPAIQYVDLNDESLIADRLRVFFEASRRLDGMTFPVLTWEEIAREYIAVYKSVLGGRI